MKKWYRSKGVKGILIILMHLALISAAAAGMFFISCFHGDIESMMSPKKYVDTEAFAREVHMESWEILQGLTGKANLEKDGKLDTEKIVDLVEYGDVRSISGEDKSGLAYRLGDLQKWGSEYKESGYYNDTIPYIVVCKKGNGSYDYYTSDEFAALVQSKKLQFVIDSTYESQDQVMSMVLEQLSYGNYTEGHEVRSLVDSKGNVQYVNIWNYTGENYGLNPADEAFHPVGADSLLDLVNNNEEWNGRLSEALDLLYVTLSELPEYISQYNVYDKYSEGNTNIAYLYVNKARKAIYSNNTSFTKYKEVKKYEESIKALGSYVIARPKLSECETSMDTDLDSWKNMLGSMPGEDSRDCYLVLGVDTSFPINDSLAQLKAEYDKYSTLLMPALFAVAIAMAVFLVGLVWLTVIAGRRPEDEELHLHPFDRWFTEVGAGVVIAVYMIPVAIGMSLSAGRSVTAYVVAGGFMGFFTCALFLVGYLSLVRRIKGKLLWKGSLLKWILVHWKTYYKKAKISFAKYTRDWNSTLKITLLFAGFILLQYILTAIFASGGYLIFTLIAILDIAVWLWLIRRALGRQILISGTRRIGEGDLDYKIPTDQLQGEQKMIAEYINRMGEGLDAAVENSLKNERMKTELITNVSHDIKTPLTSIINYVDLLKRENFTDPKIQGYLDVLEAKAQRLKILTEDVVEASKVSTGNITLNMTTLNFTEMIHQVSGEFAERFEKNNLSVVANIPEEPIVIRADGRRMYRVLENIFNNAAKYAMGGTRIYVDLVANKGRAVFNMKNISAQPLNISAEELTERFIRGDLSRSTEGSGLGLSIAKSLTELQGGTFNLYLDGDLFKVMIEFPLGLD